LPASESRPAEAPPRRGGKRTPPARATRRGADDSGRAKLVGVCLLGSTGSIGRQALEVFEALPDRFRIVAMAAGRDTEAFAEQVARVRPSVVTLADPAALARLEVPPGTEREGSAEALAAMATREDVDLVLVATTGIVSLLPVLAALGAGKVVATANKETLVAGGHLVMPLARDRASQAASRESGGADGPRGPYASPLAWLRPIDSEHSAIWQCLVGEDLGDVQRLLLTGSGGPFRGRTAAELAAVSPAEALAHPTWRMGPKVTIDSATLMNKGLEVIEAHWLYDVPYDRIGVLIHPQSIVHSVVEFADGSLKAQLGHPDMRIPIQYALTYPRRLPSPAPRLDLSLGPDLTFSSPDEGAFPALRIAREAGSRGQHATAALIAADEVAVGRFLEGRLDFPGITRLVGEAVDRFDRGGPDPSLEELLALDADVRDWAAAAPGAR
jgi:1-deoxy-D-xylulose-5-phosphate reductoisomerase